MTPQGAVSHCNMAVEAGPTKLLPFSHAFRAGYLARRRPEFRDFFEAHHVQLPLARGDALFRRALAEGWTPAAAPVRRGDRR